MLLYFEAVTKRPKEMWFCKDRPSFPHWCCLKAYLLLPSQPGQAILLVLPAFPHRNQPHEPHQALLMPALFTSFMHLKSPSKDVHRDRQGGVLLWVPGVSSTAVPLPSPEAELSFSPPDTPNQLPNSELLHKHGISSVVLQLKCWWWWHKDSCHSALGPWEADRPPNFGS